jgi:hypothetical protein
MVVYQLFGKGDIRYSRLSWRWRLTLTRNGVMPQIRPVRVSDNNAIAFSGQDKVPLLVDGETVRSGSWRIAEHLYMLVTWRERMLGVHGNLARNAAAKASLRT